MAVKPDPDFFSAAGRSLLVLGQTPFPVELIDRDFQVRYCNVAYTRCFAEDPSLVLDRPSRVFPSRLADSMTGVELLEQVARDGLWKGEVVVASPEGKLIPYCMRVFPIVDPSGSTKEFAVYYEDISREVGERESLVHQQNLVAIRSRQAQMGELLSMIAHQWRQPLTVVMSLIGNIQLKARLGTGVDPDYLKTKLERMAQHIQFLSDTIDSFRNFHAPSRHRTVEDLGALALKALDLVAPSLQKFGIKVELQRSSEPLTARVFGGEVQQLVLELLNNARDALEGGGEGSPTLRFSIVQEDGCARIRVGNNGRPIPAEVLPHIFDPYYTTKDSNAGSGLGLYMARTIVESHHGGLLTVDTNDGWTTFTSSFPLEGQP